MDYRGYVVFNQRHGFSQLDPWMRHLEPALDDRRWLADAKSMAEDAGLPYGCVAVDGGHIYEETAGERAARRDMAYRWLDVAASLGASQMRIDSGGPEELTDEIFEIVVEGYNELIPRAKAAGVEILVENHWGPTKYAENTVRLLEEVEGLGLLFDTNNWAAGTQESAWQMCAVTLVSPISRQCPSTAWATIRRSTCRKHLPSCKRMATAGSGGSNRYQRMVTRRGRRSRHWRSCAVLWASKEVPAGGPEDCAAVAD